MNREQIRTVAWGFVASALGLTILFSLGHVLETWARATFPPTQGIGVTILYMILMPFLFGIAFGLSSLSATIIFGKPFQHDERD